MPETTFHIGEVANRTGLSLRTVRHWETVGLVTPSGRTEGGFRLYTEADVQRMLIVRALKPADFSLDQLQEVADLRDQLLEVPVEDRAGHPAAVRLHAILDIAHLRFKVQRERLVSAELAVELLRGLVGDPDVEAREETPVPRSGSGVR
jgi:DNA-binding transcriptional MerR regulator